MLTIHRINMNSIVTIRTLALLLMSGVAFASCSKEQPLQKNSEQEVHSKPQFGTLHEFRSASATNVPNDRYLGHSFNLLAYRPNDMEGMVSDEVLDIAKWKSNTPWKPFAREISEDLDIPRFREEYDNVEFLDQINEDVSSSYLQDSLHLSLTGAYKKISFSYNRAQVRGKEHKQHVFSTYIYRSDIKVKALLDEDSDLEFYLSKRFVRDLKKLSPKELVTKYGTHIITAYSLGPFLELTILADRSAFSSKVTETISGSFLDQKILSQEAKRQYQQGNTRIALTYRQGGSSYYPEENLLTIGSLFTTSSLGRVNISEFKKQARRGDNIFQSLGKTSELIPIPDLISDIPLKMKYIWGLQALSEESNKGQWFVLCNPKTAEPIFHKGNFLSFTLLRNSTDQQTTLYLNDNRQKVAHESYFETGSSTNPVWFFEMNQTSGLWTVRSGRGAYLCRDFKVRTLEEDTEELRFWLINPVTRPGRISKIAEMLLLTKKLHNR